ncbi:MAG TPA: ATP-binding protein, partial [Polyangiaceae bacterium]|nr:ATP-binding protein [Polyangiaceae bacterium]
MSRHVHRLVRELKDLHERLLLLYDSAPVAYITADSMGIVREANAMALDLLHVSPNELVGSPVEQWVEFPARARFRQQFMELASAPTELQCSLCLQRGDAELREVRMEAISRPDKNEVHVALVDETAQRRAERELRELNETLGRRILAYNMEAEDRTRELDSAEEKRREAQLRDVQHMGAIGRLASGVAHEFNNLLMGIIGCAEMCLDASGNNRTLRTLLEQLRDAAVGGADIVSELMMSSRREDNRGAACLDDVVQRSKRLLQKTLGDDVRFELRLGAPNVYVPSSPVRIAQILMNLSINARQAMPRGGLLRVETHMESANELRRAVLQITDTGSGMSEDTLAHAFEPFFTTKPQGEGTGLGLSMVADIVTDAGGRIELQSTQGKGTIVSVYFPVTDATISPQPVSVLAPIGDVAKRTVLLVEDDALVREAM